MKKLVLTMIAAFALVSCGHDNFETGNYQQVKEETFVADFNKTFGVTPEVYANHQWGMELIPINTATRSVDVNSNEWEAKGYTIPADITAREIEVVSTWFKTHQNPTSETVDLTDYFVQNVYHSGDVYHAKDHNNANHDITGSNHMDYISVQKANGQWEHINNFNANSGQIQHLLNSGTRAFSFHDSYANWTSTKYVLRYINVDGVWGCYVGFDYESRGSQNGEHFGDGFYSDRIIKIVPGKGNITPPTPVDRARIMCEDLGTANSDFDYNDVVFDIKFTKVGNTYTANIILQAAGGTLPLTIGGQEVHNLFAESNPSYNISTTTMINTNATFGDHIDGLAPVEFNVELPSGNYTNAWDAINALPIIVLNANSVPVYLTTNPGTPAEMFAVPTSTEWSDERVSIQNRYPAFATWISDPSVKWWE